MTKTKKLSSVKLFHIISGAFLLVSILVLIGLGTTIGYQDEMETYSFAKETASYLETECRKYDNYEQGNSARGKQEMLDDAIGLKSYISERFCSYRTCWRRYGTGRESFTSCTGRYG